MLLNNHLNSEETPVIKSGIRSCTVFYFLKEAFITRAFNQVELIMARSIYVKSSIMQIVGMMIWYLLAVSTTVSSSTFITRHTHTVQLGITRLGKQNLDNTYPNFDRTCHVSRAGPLTSRSKSFIRQKVWTSSCAMRPKPLRDWSSTIFWLNMCLSGT